MQARIRIADLPDAGRRRCTGWQLSHEIDGERRSHLLSEGEFCVGSGAEADVRICAPGVRSRHLRLKCDSTSVYLQPLGNAAVVLDSELVRGLTRVSPSEPFRFGSVCAWIERLAPEDDIAALSIPAASVHPHTEKERDSAAASLQALNAVLEDALSTGTMPTADRLLEALDESQAPISAALFRIEGDDRAVLAERAKPGAPTGQALLEAEGTRTYRWTARGAGRELAVLYSESSAPVWQDQLAYQILLLSALSSIAVATPKPAATRDSSAGVDRSSPWHRLIGSVLRAELARSTDMCRCADSVLVLGETGTGKELAARSLHELWGRSGEFVALNCAAIPGELLDAEFFGIEPGTATGVAPQAGRIEQARGGTLFLDEISEMPMALQSKLLRVLQEREYFRLGGAKLLKADVKIVAASNLPEEELRGVKMREDLFFRLAQAKLVLPPLRNRTADIASLAEHFLTEMEARWQHGIKGLSVSALAALKEYSWPGNVRELQNVLRSAYISAPRGGLIRRTHLPLQARMAAASSAAAAALPDGGGTLASLLDQTERAAIERELATHERVPDAARALGVSESYLYRLMKKHGIRR